MGAAANRFEVSEYLVSNPDVARAVVEGRLPPAWRHYVEFGFQEKRPGVPDTVRKRVQSLGDIAATDPPANLILRVHGSSDPAGFRKVGRTVALDIHSAVDRHLDLDRPLQILDFGCGCGRVLRYMMEIAPLSNFHASDIDEEAIRWCRETYRECALRRRCSFVVNRDLPPTPYQSDYFDFVYAISVFTHLPEQLQFRWLEELVRITKTGGTLVISTAHGALIREHLSPENRRILEEKGFYYFPYGRTEGLPDYYQAAWHTRSYVRQVWSRYFKIVELIPAGIAGHQDLILGRKG